MKTIFDNTLREALVNRIRALNNTRTAQWGKMNVYQMTKHCTIWNDWIFGKSNLSNQQTLLGRIFGKMALRGIVADDKPMKKGMPSGRGFIIKEKDGDIELQKKIWIEQVAGYEHFSNPGFVHDFFGKMTVEEIGILAYKHFDHHLRQFNV